MSNNSGVKPVPVPKSTTVPLVLVNTHGSCEVTELPGGQLSITFVIDDPASIKRLKLRAGPMNIAMYIWENIIKRAVYDHLW